MARWEGVIKKFNDRVTELAHVDLASHAPNFEGYRAALRVAQINALPSGRRPHIKEENAAYLYHLLVASTGKPHYKEVADLIEDRLRCGESQGQLRTDLVATDLRDIVKRFKRDNLPRFMSLLQGVTFSLRQIPAAWHKMPTAVEGAN
jgi:hypothetical protein